MIGMGASFMALFARVGGGIYTKAADVGADLVGKVEAGIPEDDPRNPATIADNVGDNVGDVAGMGADLYESYVGSILATFCPGRRGRLRLGRHPAARAAGRGGRGVLHHRLLPGQAPRRTPPSSPCWRTLRNGTYTAAVLAAVIAAPLTYFMLGSWGVYIAILCGLIGGCAIGYFTEYYTSDTYKPTQNLADSTETGAATTIIGGISLGMKSTLAPILIVAVAVIVLLPGRRRHPGHVDAGDYHRAVHQGPVRHRHRRRGHAVHPGHHPGHRRLRPRGRQRRRHRRDERPGRGGPGAHRRPGLPGQHHRRHRQGLRHRLRRPHRPGPAGVAMWTSCRPRRGRCSTCPSPTPPCWWACSWAPCSPSSSPPSP